MEQCQRVTFYIAYILMVVMTGDNDTQEIVSVVVTELLPDLPECCRPIPT